MEREAQPVQRMRVLSVGMGANGRHLTDDELTSLVGLALDGDQPAWEQLVRGLERVVWKTVVMMTSDSELRNDAFAATWLRLAERLPTIREPQKLPGWLATTAANEVRQIVRQRGHDHVPFSGLSDSDDGFGPLDQMVDDGGDRAAELVAAERRRDVRAAFGRLDDSCRELITVLVLADPPIPYDEASEQLGRPIGALGPTRARCLDKLKNLIDTQPGATAHG